MDLLSKNSHKFDIILSRNFFFIGVKSFMNIAIILTWIFAKMQSLHIFE